MIFKSSCRCHVNGTHFLYTTIWPLNYSLTLTANINNNKMKVKEQKWYCVCALTLCASAFPFGCCGRNWCNWSLSWAWGQRSFIHPYKRTFHNISTHTLQILQPIGNKQWWHSDEWMNNSSVRISDTHSCLRSGSRSLKLNSQSIVKKPKFMGLPCSRPLHANRMPSLHKHKGTNETW